MASKANDALRARTVAGSVNMYNGGSAIATAEDYALCARSGSVTYDIIAPMRPKEEIPQNFPAIKCDANDSHGIDLAGNHTDWMMDRRKKFPDMHEPLPLAEHLQNGPMDHPKVNEFLARRTETQLVQSENPQDWAAYQRRRLDFRDPTPRVRRTLDEAWHKLSPKIVTGRTYQTEMGLQADALKAINEKRLRAEATRSSRSARSSRSSRSCRSGEVTMVYSARSNRNRDKVNTPLISVRSAVSDIYENRRKAYQMQNESCHFAHNRVANTYSNSHAFTDEGVKLHQGRRCFSLNRLENMDFAVTRANNHWCREDKLTRQSPYYMKPKASVTNGSVKYDLVNNRVPPFIY